ncbi:hypothetical protein GCM10009557_89710 [Virgisporangium ochraceum]
MLCGRVAETSRIDALLAGARAGRSGVLVLVGNDGVGRSTLLGHAASAAVGMSVVWVRGSWTARRLAYGGLAQLVVPRADVLEVGGQAVLGRQSCHTTPWLTERHG